MLRFGQKKGKLSPQYIGLFEILERVGKVAYKLALPPRLSGVHNVFHISMLKEYHEGAILHVIDFQDLEVNDNVSYQERPVRILGNDIRKLRNKEIPLVKIQWKHHDEREASWEMESEMHVKYLELFQD